MVEDTLQQGVIQPNSSSFAFPSLLVKKKDLSWRFCIDYSKLIEMRVKNKFLVPIIENYMGLWCFQRLTCDKGTSRFNWKRKINANLLSSFIMAFSSSRLCHLGSWMPRRHFKTWWIAFSLTCSKNEFLSFLTTFWSIAVISNYI